MRKKNSESGESNSRSDEGRPSRTGKKPAAKRSFGSDNKRSFGKKSETGSAFDKRRSFSKDGASDRKTGGSYNSDKPFKKSFRKDESSQEGGSYRKSNFKRDDKPSDFKKRPSTYRKRSDGDGEKSFGSEKPFNRDKPFSSDKPYKSDKPFNREKTYKSERSFKSDKPYKSDRSDKPYYKSDKSYKSSDKPFNSDKPFKSDRPFNSDKPFKKSFRKDESSQEGGSYRKSNFKRDDKPSDFKKRPSTYRKRSDGDGEKSFGSEKPFNRDKPFSSDKPYKSDKPFNREKTYSSDDRPFKKTYRRDDESTENNEGGYKRRSDSFDKRSQSGDKPAKSFGKKKPFSKDISFEEVKPKPGRKRSDEKSPFAFDGKTQTPPEYNLQGYEKRGKGRSKSKTQNVEKDEEDEIRLNRYIANAGICSRREADVLIESGEIKVNGNVMNELGYRVKPGDVVKYGNRTLNREKMLYVLLNKPKDFITTTEDPEERKTVMELVKNAGQERIYPVGRLDRNTTGLLLLTNDGELAEKLSHPSNEVQKLYEVEIDRPITPEDYQAIIDGVTLEDGLAKVDDLAIVSPDRKFIGIALHLGRNRIVRRIFEHLGYKVVKLDRTVYAGLTKKDLPRGHWRYLSEKEVVRLKYFV